MNMREFITNRQRFPLEELSKYRGKYIAWSPDGSAIIASDESEVRLDAAIRELGYDPAEVPVSAVPAEDAIVGGGGLIG